MALISRQTRALFDRWLIVAAAIALFGLVAGAKWTTIFRFGSDIPHWDQWDAEAAFLLTPWFERNDFSAHFFNPHNEHHVLLTKLQCLALVLLNGQWDARLECVVNAILHASIAVAAWLAASRAVPHRWHAPLFALVAALFGLPLAWENILSGFHSQQYLLIGLSLIAILFLPFARTGSAPWWVGAISATLALGSMASGFLAAVAVAAVLGFRLFRREASVRQFAPTIALISVLIVIGIATRVDVPPHAGLKARTASEFFLSIIRSLAWPMRDHDWVGVLFWFPWGLVFWRTVTSPAVDSRQRVAQTLTALGGWVLLQIVATAYARGAGADYPAIRYADTLAIGVLVNGASLAWLLSNPRDSGRQRDSLPGSASAPGSNFDLCVAGTIWLIVLGGGLRETLQRSFESELPGRAEYYRKAENCLRGYLATNDPAHLIPSDVPYPDSDTVLERLSHPALRALMPASVRAPLPLKAADSAATGAGTFKESSAGTSRETPPLPHQSVWGSFASGIGATGEWMSAPLESPFGSWLIFEAAGHLGEPGTSLEVHDAVTGVIHGKVRVSDDHNDSWRPGFVKVSRRPFVVVARDTDPQRWFAFSAPVEMGSLSYWAWRCAKRGEHLLAGSAVLALIVGALAFRTWWRQAPFRS